MSCKVVQLASVLAIDRNGFAGDVSCHLWNRDSDGDRSGCDIRFASRSGLKQAVGKFGTEGLG